MAHRMTSSEPILVIQEIAINFIRPHLRVRDHYDHLIFNNAFKVSHKTADGKSKPQVQCRALQVVSFAQLCHNYLKECNEMIKFSKPNLIARLISSKLLNASAKSRMIKTMMN